MTRTLLDGRYDGDAGLLGALATRARERRLAADLAEAEFLEGAWVEPEPGRVSAPLLRLAADSGDASRYATEPPLDLPDGTGLRVTLEPTSDGAWIVTAERLYHLAGGLVRSRPRVSVRVSAREDERGFTLILPEGEDIVATRASFEPGASPAIEAGFED